MTPAQQALKWIYQYGLKVARIVANEFVKNRTVPVKYWAEVLETLKP